MVGHVCHVVMMNVPQCVQSISKHTRRAVNDQQQSRQEAATAIVAPEIHRPATQKKSVKWKNGNEPVAQHK